MTRSDWHPTYPQEVPFLDHFGDRFDSAMVVLHPFLLLPEEVAARLAALEGDERYPSDEVIADHAAPRSWSWLCDRLSFAGLEELNRTMLTSMGGLSEEYADPTGADELNEFLEAHPIWPPAEGRIEPLLLPPILSLLTDAGYHEFFVRDEFGEDGRTLPIPEEDRALRLALAPAPFVVASVSSPDDAILALVHWNSFYTILLGPRSTIDSAERVAGLEGFRCTEDTTHLWWFREPVS
ncbi:MAG: DUF2711 family protein [Myxococcota bacterium]